MTTSPTLSWRFRGAGLVKKRVLSHYRIPYSQLGLPTALEAVFKPNEPVTLIDLGASGGEFTAAVQQYAGLRRALLVEAQPARCRELRARFGDPIAVRECAVFDHNGSASMDILGWDYSSSLLRLKPEVGGFADLVDVSVRERIQVECRRLDDLLDVTGWNEPIDILKLDIQGAELRALQGATRALARTRLLVTEVSFRPMYEGSAVFADIYQFLAERGFRLHSLEDGFRGADGELLQADAVFLPIAQATHT